MTERKSAAFRILANVGHLVSGKAAAGVISLGYLVIAAKSLGVTEYGVLNLVHGYVQLIGGIIAFSGWHGIVRYGTDALQRGEHERLLALTRFMSLVEFGLGILAALVAALTAHLVGPSLGWPPEAVQFMQFYCLAVFATVRATPAGILQMAGRFDLIAAHQTVMPLCRLAGALLVWFLDGGLMSFLWVWLLSALAEGVSMWVLGLWALHRMRLPAGLRGSVRGVVPANPGLVRFVVTTNADLTLRDLAPRLIPLVIGWTLGPAATGLYSLAQRVGTVLQQPALLLGQASYAVFADLITSRQLSEARRAVSKSVFVATATALPIAAVMALAGKPILGLLGGKDFKQGVGLLALIAVGRAIAMGTPALSSALSALGRPGKSISVNLFTNLGLLPLLPLSLMTLGLNGAGWLMILQSCIAVASLWWLFDRAIKLERQ